MYVEGNRCLGLVVCPGVFVLHFFKKKEEKKRKRKDLLIVENIFNQASYKTKTHLELCL